ncbi:MAG: alkaline phosphatase [Bacteroidota bacterium]
MDIFNWCSQALIILLLLGCGETKKATDKMGALPKSKKEYPKNIVLMIGDGMGLSQVTAAIYSSKKKLNLERFPVIGFHKSHSADNLKTDSAAGATAFACGIKTYNGAIGMGTDTMPCFTILEEAEAKGMATGMVVTSPITHATPAAFVAHEPMRVFFENIAADFLDVEVDFLVGGGQRYFDYREFDERNLYKELQEKGYSVKSFRDSELTGYRPKSDQNFIYFSANSDPLPVIQGRSYLPYASKMGINFLKKHSEKGFFMMIEGSQIDWAGHANEGQLLVAEMLDFDKAIGEVLAMATEDGETLVIVTADHETGGLAINPGSKKRKLKLEFTTNDHTSTMIPVFAFGPQAELFSGIYDNTAIHTKMRKALRFDQSISNKGVSESK